MNRMNLNNLIIIIEKIESMSFIINAFRTKYVELFTDSCFIPEINERKQKKRTKNEINNKLKRISGTKSHSKHTKYLHSKSMVTFAVVSVFGKLLARHVIIVC